MNSEKRYIICESYIRDSDRVRVYVFDNLKDNPLTYEEALVKYPKAEYTWLKTYLD